MISDGGACLIVTSADRASATRTAPVYLLGMEQVTALRQYQNPDNLLRPWVAELREPVFGRAGVAAQDVDVLYVQDPVSVWVCQMLERYGFCGPGEPGPSSPRDARASAASIPVNTNGGQLSESYMWGWLHLCEAVRQLRGECGQRQVAGASLRAVLLDQGLREGRDVDPLDRGADVSRAARECPWATPRCSQRRAGSSARPRRGRARLAAAPVPALRRLRLRRLPAASRAVPSAWRPLDWQPRRGLGTVWSCCVYHRAFDPAFSDALPYNVALVELDSGPRLI